MFTGIIETVGEVVDLHREAGNLFITMNSAIGNELTVDQSVAHNGVCLTVVKTHQTQHVVTAIEETLSKTNLGNLHIGDLVNLERCLQMGGRLDGHIVQGHVDGKAKLLAVLEQNGSYVLNFEIDAQFRNLIVEKGSICLNGISLTLINVTDITFAVAIIPYTWEHTNIQTLKIGDDANVEFDIIGKYVNRMQRFN
ncbi:MAG: riboflavin synthase [Bacteroidetes bacterium]|jgi:riboflavin synthase|nr:riboflavin synthase [Bacteroidota bacterium]MBL0282108.1 riboflavin synthase [Bacteroidota bacterium]